MQINRNEPISEQYLKKAHEWAQLENVASMLEEGKSSMLAKLVLAEGDVPINRAETRVKASSEWHDYILAMVNARTAVNHAKVDLVYLQMRHREKIGEDADNRLASKL